MKRAVMLALAGAVMLGYLQAGPPVSAQSPDALSFFKNYIITGDYAVGGIGLRGAGVNGVATSGAVISASRRSAAAISVEATSVAETCSSTTRTIRPANSTSTPCSAPRKRRPTSSAPASSAWGPASCPPV